VLCYLIYYFFVYVWFVFVQFFVAETPVIAHRTGGLKDTVCINFQNILMFFFFFF
jgi:hypothetical protein